MHLQGCFQSYLISVYTHRSQQEGHIFRWFILFMNILSFFDVLQTQSNSPIPPTSCHSFPLQSMLPEHQLKVWMPADRCNSFTHVSNSLTQTNSSLEAPKPYQHGVMP